MIFGVTYCSITFNPVRSGSCISRKSGSCSILFFIWHLSHPGFCIYLQHDCVSRDFESIALLQFVINHNGFKRWLIFYKFMNANGTSCAVWLWKDFIIAREKEGRLSNTFLHNRVQFVREMSPMVRNYLLKDLHQSFFTSFLFRSFLPVALRTLFHRHFLQ